MHQCQWALRRLIGESRALRQIGCAGLLRFVRRCAMLTYTSTLPEAEHARPRNRTAGGAGRQQHRPRAHGVGGGRHRAGRHAVRARRCRRGRGPPRRDRRRHGGEAQLLRTVRRLPGRAGAPRPHLRLSGHRRLPPRLARRLEGAHARLVHPRRPGRARLGASHLPAATHPLGRTQHGRLRHRPCPQQPPDRPPAQRRHAQRLLGPHGRARALSRAPAHAVPGSAGRVGEGLLPRRADGRRGHAGSGLPRVDGLVHGAGVPVRRRDVARAAAFRRIPRAHPLRAGRRRPLGYASRRRPHGRAFLGKRRSLDLAGDARRSRRAEDRPLRLLPP